MDYLSIILFAFVVAILVKIYEEFDYLQLKCIISSVDGNTYCVRDRLKLELAADLLAVTTKKMNKLVEHMKTNLPEHEITKLLEQGYNPKKIQETLPTSKHTAYSENKGEKLAFCLNKDDTGKLIDENTLMFVALHELSHIGTDEIGHTDKYWRNFKFILEQATEIGVYNPVDYTENPEEYCGMSISDNPYYDLK
tara:strand:+ start:1546 stop:2130 length:585 start_codon:yes stop_codon:yes gene_type:complete